METILLDAITIAKLCYGYATNALNHEERLVRYADDTLETEYSLGNYYINLVESLQNDERRSLITIANEKGGLNDSIHVLYEITPWGTEAWRQLDEREFSAAYDYYTKSEVVAFKKR